MRQSGPMVLAIPVAIVLATIVVSGTKAASSDERALAGKELRWLNRVTFGIDSVTAARYRLLGRNRFLDEQLHLGEAPPELAADIAALETTQRSAADLLKAARAEQQRINQLPDDQKQPARMAANRAAQAAVFDVQARHLMRALYAPSQLREQMTWFWMNHFTVFAGKGNVRWTIGEYEERAIRPHALGKFRDLVLATVTAPAMLEYLDNAQSAAGKINENYARELMELHTLGVSGGPSRSTYSQQDVQELARVLTGVGVSVADASPRLPPAKRALYVREGAFEFNPNRHDAGTKTLLGHVVEPGGMDEVERAIAMLCREPATARFISAKLATYFVADEPPPALVEAMASSFTKSDGDIAAVLKTMFQSSQFAATLERPDGRKLKDPMQFVVSALRLAYDGKRISNYRPIVNWLAQLGEPLYGRVTPDGYPLTDVAWSSSGQLVKRFEIARAIGSGNAGLFNTEAGQPGPRIGFPMLTNRLFYDAIEPALGATTRAALAQTASQQEWNTVLLSSPDWMER